MNSFISSKDCKIGFVYKLRSRNLSFGVFTGRGYIGIREKFDSTYLFEEYSYDEGGTAKALEEVGDLTKEITNGMLLLEHYPQCYCYNCGDILTSLPIQPDRIPWEHQNNKECPKPYATCRNYMPLMVALKHFEIVT